MTTTLDSSIELMRDLFGHIVQGSLHQHFVVLLMQPLDPVRHWTLAWLSRLVRLCETVVEDGLESKLCDSLVFLYFGAHLEEAITLPDVRQARGVSAAHDN